MRIPAVPVFTVFVLYTMWTSMASASDTQNAVQPGIRFATDLIEPYQMMSEDGQLSGMAIPVIDCALKSLNFNYTIDVLPWARAQKNVELGNHDAFFVASRNSERDAYATASEPMFEGKRSWVLNRGIDADPLSEKFKNNHRVGAVFGTNMHAWLKENYKHVVDKTDKISLIELLQSGRIDAVLATDAMLEFAVFELGIEIDDFVVREADPHPLGVYFGHKFLTKHPSLIERFNAALKACRPLAKK